MAGLQKQMPKSSKIGGAKNSNDKHEKNFDLKSLSVDKTTNGMREVSKKKNKNKKKPKRKKR